MDAVVRQLTNQHTLAIEHLEVITRKQVTQGEHLALIFCLGLCKEAIDGKSSCSSRRK